MVVIGWAYAQSGFVHSGTRHRFSHPPPPVYSGNGCINGHQSPAKCGQVNGLPLTCNLPSRTFQSVLLFESPSYHSMWYATSTEIRTVRFNQRQNTGVNCPQEWEWLQVNAGLGINWHQIHNVVTSGYWHCVFNPPVWHGCQWGTHNT